MDIFYSRAIYIVPPELNITKPDIDVSILVATNNKASQRSADNQGL